MKNLEEIFYILGKDQKKGFLSLCAFSVFVGVIESFAVGLIMPFITLANDPSFEGKISLANPSKAVLYTSLALASFYLLRFFINQKYFLSLAKLCRYSYLNTALALYKKVLKLSFKEYKMLLKSELLKSLTQEAFNFSIMLQSLLLLLSELFVFLLLYALLCSVSFKVCLVISAYLGINAFFLLKYLNPHIKKSAFDRDQAMSGFYECINQSLNSFMQNKLKAKDEELVKSYHESALKFAKANVRNDYYQSLPRNYLETNAFCILVLFIGFLVGFSDKGISFYLPTITLFLAALYRLLPSLNRIITSYHQISFYHHSLKNITKLLKKDDEVLGCEGVSLRKTLSLEGLSFSYDENLLLKDINASFNVGEKIFISGDSGSGKSTLIGLISTLLLPCSGCVRADGVEITKENKKSFRKNIALITQEEHFLNKSVLENIYGFKKPDETKALKLLKAFELAGFKDRVLGDDAKALSTGQRMRLALCRGLFMDTRVIILDEASSSLDVETEAKVLKELYKLCEDKILIIISHRDIKGDFKSFALKDGLFIKKSA